MYYVTLSEKWLLILGVILAWIPVSLATKLWKFQKEAEDETEREALAAQKKAQRKTFVERELKSLLDKHLRKLAVKKQQLTTTDDYGIEDNARWLKELDYFIVKVTLPALNYNLDKSEIQEFVQCIESSRQ